ncbi:hypothetical protein CISIN_1g037571mg [Citrus sinensis]|uniref:UDP-glycosyltransferases domain-containing protein n=1 Tax=Citrus sinensis TaxID=2711 RepID=A0A067DI82_CITSI|nr:hypothetical protein CISIN_1g037571mg [Citrus sinensis]
MSIRASAFVINTYIHIGPLHEIHESGIRECSPSVSTSGVLRKEDKSCMTWLDLQPSRSVLYVKSGIGLIPTELEEGTQERRLMIDWAPQEDVLAHQAICGFLTHSGWNSASDGMVNSRCVREVGKIGLDMKDTCDRSTVEKLVRNLIDNKRKEIMEPMDRGATVARDAVKEGGSSFKATWTG